MTYIKIYMILNNYIKDFDFVFYVILDSFNVIIFQNRYKRKLNKFIWYVINDVVLYNSI
jgi:hypothetical protein